jgi:AsmA family protein
MNAFAKGLSQPVRWIAGVVVVLLLLILCLALMDWNAARGPLSRIISRHIERPVSIGHLSVHLLSATPSVDIQDLTIGNPDWAAGGNMVDLPHLHVAAILSRLLVGRLVLQTLELENPRVSLIQDQNGRANWNLGTNEPKQKRQKPTTIPPLRHFALSGGSLKLDDAVHKLTFQGTVAATEQSGRNSDRDAEPFRLEGQGTLNKEPFKLVFEGGALMNIELDHPYRFQTSVDAGQSSVKLRGLIAKPFDLGRMDADIELQGQNLANLYYLTNLALPLTRPYRLSVHAHRDGNHFAFDGIEGKIGDSDIHGKGSVDLAEADGRPKLTVSLTSHSLNLADLGVAVGAGVPEPGDQTGKAPSQIPAPKQEPISPLVLPTFTFQFDRLRAMDAKMDFKAESVQAQKVPIKNVVFGLKLDHGALDIDPLEFQLPEGKLGGMIHLDANAQVPRTSIDLKLSDVHLDQFKPKNSTDAPVEGVMEGRLRIEGSGNSVHAIGAAANGTLSAVITRGQMRAAFAELAGIDVVRGLGLLLTKKDETVPISCGVAEFQLKNGDAQTQQLVVDTQNVIVTGDGHLTLDDEKLDLNLKGEPKKPRFDRLRAPINVRGTLRHPSVSLSTPALAKQGAAAVVLGAVATPFAAILAFVDPGLAKSADCADLTKEAEGKVAQPPPPSEGKP